MKNKHGLYFESVYTFSRTKGFTIVELLIVIVVIAILAAISIIVYNGIQTRAATSVVKNDLKDALVAMEMSNVQSGSYPTSLPASVQSPKDVTLTLKSAGENIYSGLTASQNGLLFINTCQDLISEGLGAKPDDNHDYISSCVVFNKNQIQVNGWNGRTINTSITTASLASYVSSYTGGSVSEFQQHSQAFMDGLASRFQARGGQFPVMLFWDSWATPTNGGVMQPTLPAPISSSGNPEDFCLEAFYKSHPEIIWHAKKTIGIVSGSCSS